MTDTHFLLVERDNAKWAVFGREAKIRLHLFVILPFARNATIPIVKATSPPNSPPIPILHIENATDSDSASFEKILKSSPTIIPPITPAETRLLLVNLLQCRSNMITGMPSII